MKKGLVYAVFVMILASCGNSGNSGSSSDTLDAVPDATNVGKGDTTGLDVGAAQPIDSTNQLRPPMGDEPGAKRSGVYDKIDSGSNRGVDSGTRSRQ